MKKSNHSDTNVEAQAAKDVVQTKSKETQSKMLKRPIVKLPRRDRWRLGDAVIAAVVSGFVSMILFAAHYYFYWPFQREQLASDIQKTVEETTLAKIAQDLTAAQTIQTNTRADLERIDAELKNIEKKYAEPLKMLEAQGKIQQNQLTSIQIYLASIEQTTKEIRENSAVTRETIEAASALATLQESVRPHAEISTKAEIMQRTNLNFSSPQKHRPNKVKITAVITNIGIYAFSISTSGEVIDASGNDIDVGAQTEGPVTPSGTVLSGQTIGGSMIISFPQDWVDTRVEKTIIVIKYHLQTAPDVLDSVARNVNVKGLREKLNEKATFIHSFQHDIFFR